MNSTLLVPNNKIKEIITLNQTPEKFQQLSDIRGL